MRTVASVSLLLAAVLSWASLRARPAERPTVPSLEPSGQAFDGPQGVWGLDVGDLDGDGDLDVVLASLARPTVLLNDGRGRFVASAQSFPIDMHDVAVGDLNRDGAPDLFFANVRDNRQVVWLNDGRANFTATALVADRSGSIQLLDADRDGDLDAYMGKGSRLFVNDGRGAFAVATVPIPEYSVLRDLNGDGRPDSIHRGGKGPGGWGFDIRLSDETQPFSRRLFAAVAGVSLLYDNLAFADVDRDGDVDVLYTDALAVWDRRSDGTHPSGVLLNDGTGRLVDGGQRWLPQTDYGYVCQGDLNGDGSVDLLVTGWDQPARVWLNDGKGRFSDSQVRLGDKLGWSNCAVADFDKDGDQDVFLADRRTGRHKLWFNKLAENGPSALPRKATR